MEKGKKMKRKKSGKIVLLRDNVNEILMVFVVNFTNKGESIL